MVASFLQYALKQNVTRFRVKWVLEGVRRLRKNDENPLRARIVYVCIKVEGSPHFCSALNRSPKLISMQSIHFCPNSMSMGQFRALMIQLYVDLFVTKFQHLFLAYLRLQLSCVTGSIVTHVVKSRIVHVGLQFCATKMLTLALVELQGPRLCYCNIACYIYIYKL